MSKHSEQVMKQRKKLKRVELLLRPQYYEAIKAIAEEQSLTVAAYIKGILRKEIET